MITINGSFTRVVYSAGKARAPTYVPQETHLFVMFVDPIATNLCLSGQLLRSPVQDYAGHGNCATLEGTPGCVDLSS